MPSRASERLERHCRLERTSPSHTPPLRQRYRDLAMRNAPLLFLVSVLAACSGTRTLQNLPRVDDEGYLHVRGLIVEDEHGVCRVAIAAPTPAPKRNGEVVERRSSGLAGIQLNDPEGNERGGFGMLSDGTVSVMTDHSTRDGAGAVVWSNGGAEVRAAGMRGLHQISVGVTPDGFVGIYVVDPEGLLLGRLRLVKDGEMFLGLEDADGNALFSVPATARSNSEDE